MSFYSIHALDRQGEIALSQMVRCSDDLDAPSAGIEQSDMHAVEIWDGQRLVARVKLGNAPLDTADVHSL